MELHLGLALSSSSSSASSCSAQFDLNSNYNCSYTQESIIPVEHLKKRKYDDDYDHVPQTLPLLVWNSFCCNKNQFNDEVQHHDHDGDNDDDDDDDVADGDGNGGGGDNEVQSNLIFDNHRNDGGVIGWPPVKLCRRKQSHRKLGKGGVGGGGGGQGDVDGGGSKSMYVKVYMEGVGIARKVDLNLHNTYQTLVHTLANMFGKRYEDVKLTYQDKDGDWLLAGDVPWGSFIKTIQRLKLLRK